MDVFGSVARHERKCFTDWAVVAAIAVAALGAEAALMGTVVGRPLAYAVAALDAPGAAPTARPQYGEEIVVIAPTTPRPPRARVGALPARTGDAEVAVACEICAQAR